MKEVKRVYICGPITPRGNRNKSVEHLTNIKRGIQAGKMLMRMGFSPYNPFLDYSYWLVDDNDFFLSVNHIRRMDLDWVDVADAVFCLPKWKKSVGAQGEVERAKKKGVPIFDNIDALVEYRDKCREEK